MPHIVDVDILLRDLKKEPGRTGIWNFYNPKNLYLTDAQGKAYLEMMGDPRYASKFHDKTETLISEHAAEIASHFSDERVLIVDLGPGYPSKTLPIVDALIKDNKEIEYWAVDVNEYFGNIARDAIKEKGISRSYAKKMLFEDAPDYLEKNKVIFQKLVIIGLTFMNFEPQYILEILKDCVSNKGDVCISAIECLDNNNDIGSLTEGYRSAAATKLLFSPLALLGAEESNADYKVDFINNRIEMGFVLHRVPSRLRKLGVRENDYIITAISYRHKEDDYRKLLSSSFGKNEYFKLGNTILAVSRDRI